MEPDCPPADFSHHQPEIRRRRHEGPQHACRSCRWAQVGPTHAAGFIRVGETAFRVLRREVVAALGYVPLDMRGRLPYTAALEDHPICGARGRARRGSCVWPFGLQRLRRVVAVIDLSLDHFGDQRWRLQSLADRLIEHDVVQISSRPGSDSRAATRVPLIGAAHGGSTGPGYPDRPYARPLPGGCVRPHLGNAGVRIVRVCQSSLEPFLGRFLSSLARSCRVGVSMPSAWARPSRYSSEAAVYAPHGPCVAPHWPPASWRPPPPSYL